MSRANWPQSGGPSPAPSVSPAGSESPVSPSAAAASPSAPPAPATVRLALDWTPNTNHTGFFVAEHEGWYADAAITLRILPYSGTTPETLIGAHQAECGISFQDSMTFAVAGLVAAGETLVRRPASASISYPGFFPELERVRA